MSVQWGRRVFAALLCFIALATLCLLKPLSFYINRTNIPSYPRDLSTSDVQTSVNKLDRSDSGAPWIPKLTSTRQIVNITLVHVTSHFNSSTHDVSNSASTTSQRNGASHVLLVTSYRSGSTFLGSLFSSDPETYYTFEPLYFLRGCKHVTAADRVSAMVDLLFHCNPWTILSSAANCSDWRDVRNHVEKVFNTDDPDQITSLCRRKKRFASKVIRVYELESAFEPMMSRNGSVVFYFRDPRGVFSSRISLGLKPKAETWLNEERKYCQRLATNLRFLRAIYARHGEKACERLTVLRYEDLALDPEKKTYKLFNFLGRQVPKQVLQHIKRNTETSARKERPYGVQRDSRATAESWRHKLSWRQTLSVQSVCADVMKEAGYDLSSPNNLNNVQLRESFIRPLPGDIPCQL